MEQIVKQLTDALNECMEIQEQLSDALTECENENIFLTDTIVNVNLGKITQERRQLLAESARIQRDSQHAIAQAEQVKQQYSELNNELIERITDIKAKQENIDSYIDAESDKKIQDTKKSLSKKLNAKKADLQAVFDEKENEQTIIMKSHNTLIVCLAVGILFSFFSVIFNSEELVLQLKAILSVGGLIATVICVICIVILSIVKGRNAVYCGLLIIVVIISIGEMLISIVDVNIPAIITVALVIYTTVSVTIKRQKVHSY